MKKILNILVACLYTVMALGSVCPHSSQIDTEVPSGCCSNGGGNKECCRSSVTYPCSCSIQSEETSPDTKNEHIPGTGSEQNKLLQSFIPGTISDKAPEPLDGDAQGIYAGNHGDPPLYAGYGLSITLRGPPAMG